MTGKNYSQQGNLISSGSSALYLFLRTPFQNVFESVTLNQGTRNFGNADLILRKTFELLIFAYVYAYEFR